MTQTETRSRTSVHLLLLLSTGLAASSFPVGAEITSELDPAILMCLRFWLASVLFAPFVFLKNGFVIPSRAAGLRYATLSLPLVVFFWCMFKSLRYTSALNTGSIFTLYPAITALFALVINRERIRPNRILALGVGSFGALWIIFRGNLVALLEFDLNRGDLIFFIGCIAMGTYGPLIKRFFRGEPQEIMTFWTLFAGSVWLTLLSGSGLWSVSWAEVPPKVYVGILYLAVVCTLITFFILQYCTVRLTPTRASVYSLLVPVFVIAVDVLVIRSPFVWATLPGVLLVIAAVLAVQREVHPRDTGVTS